MVHYCGGESFGPCTSGSMTRPSLEMEIATGTQLVVDSLNVQANARMSIFLVILCTSSGILGIITCFARRQLRITVAVGVLAFGLIGAVCGGLQERRGKEGALGLYFDRPTSAQDYAEQGRGFVYLAGPFAACCGLAVEASRRWGIETGD